MNRFACALAAALSVALPAAASDADFLAAKAAFERNDEKALVALQPKLAGHVLAPYAEYWRLKLGLDVADEADVRAFLGRNAGSPLADLLRTDWLKMLGLRGLWTQFAQDYVPLPSDDVELACFAIQARREREGDAALAAAKPLWLTGRATPDACAPLFAALFASGQLTATDRYARLRLASEAGNVRLVQALALDGPPGDRIPEKDLRRVEANPLGALAGGEFAWR
ncbi:MAG TPA: hypothetical protein VFX05_13095, partial [Casimicrobiaceae bacterium]|nr:hypothetical protein [Casimicrobiaceae bacterium]